MSSAENSHITRAIAQIAAKVRDRFLREGTGHDWWHIERVRRMALEIGRAEEADLVIVELGALLHDMADHKLHGGDVEAGIALIEQWLHEEELGGEIADPVIQIARHVSYKGAKVEDTQLDLEGRVVRDADRLDAMGAIGIARTFAYGGSKGRLLYDPGLSPEFHQSFDEYKGSTAPTINHFYEKLLLLKDRMHTETGKRLADERHRFMETYLDQFFREWNGSAND